MYNNDLEEEVEFFLRQVLVLIIK